MNEKYFPKREQFNPRIYAYKDKNPNHKEYLKIGYTTIDTETRIRQQFQVLQPEDKPYEIIFDETAMREDGTSFRDKDIHKVLGKTKEHINGEWYKCTLKDLQAAYLSVYGRTENEEYRTQNFPLRSEQNECIEKTSNYFKSFKSDTNVKVPHFLWNAKMRFGKTFTAYKLAEKMNYNKILVLTFKPAVINSWREDLLSHVDFEGWQFVSNNSADMKLEQVDINKQIVCFGSFQDYLGKNSAGGIKAKNEIVHKIDWDLVILDEYHYGAWRENAKELFESESEREKNYGEGEGIEYFREDLMPIKTKAYLYLSGTPFRAIAQGEFIEEQIYNWTYSDEQKAKENYKGKDNPYAPLPKMVLMTYQLPDSVIEVASKGQFDQFDLNIFFSAEGEKQEARFKYKDDVQKWLDLIRGSYVQTNIDNLKQGAEKVPMPFNNTTLMSNLNHTFWFLPTVASCYAMYNLLNEKQNVFYHEFKIIIAAGNGAGIGERALIKVEEQMKDPINSKTITLSCGKLTTGVTVKPWGGIFMLRNLTTPETYFQAAFRVQSPWTITTEDNKKEIIKKVCYVFDFAPNRALRQIADYSCRLDVTETKPENKVKEFINFLPVLAYDGISMKALNASNILDIAMSGTSATLLARRWESALLVNVDDLTLKRLFANQDAMDALMKIEGFRALNKDLETIINKSEAIKNKKQKANDEDLTPKEKRELSEDEREYKSKRKQIQEKLIKFATRIPVFMYLTDYRESTLKDIITELEPELFQKVTGLLVKDFELLLSLNVFNSTIMNQAVYNFRRYEDSSLSYTGIAKHSDLYDRMVGLFDTAITIEEFNRE